ncbi:unnamed protein product [Toxocara canis]|uniref:Ovule protein n=1 Tax=Toxocara canis TaxID=6265 RepID=A0A183VF58_TOXCA|nr:unnamed protein product [Toxocara canis]
MTVDAVATDTIPHRQQGEKSLLLWVMGHASDLQSYFSKNMCFGAHFFLDKGSQEVLKQIILGSNFPIAIRESDRNDSLNVLSDKKLSSCDLQIQSQRISDSKYKSAIHSQMARGA